jgi:Ni/Co efflux regulator RcnB
MKKLLISASLISLVSAIPTMLAAQEQPGGRPPSESHPPPMAAPHAASTYHPTVAPHPTTHYRTTSHVTVSRSVREPTHVHIDISTYHRNITAERRFHYGEYRAPAGYEYRRWTYGERLPREYFAQDYWIANYLNFGLPWAPDGCEWVRFGPDALLVDVDTGEIIQVVYGVFY